MLYAMPCYACHAMLVMLCLSCEASHAMLVMLCLSCYACHAKLVMQCLQYVSCSVSHGGPSRVESSQLKRSQLKPSQVKHIPTEGKRTYTYVRMCVCTYACREGHSRPAKCFLRYPSTNGVWMRPGQTQLQRMLRFA